MSSQTMTRRRMVLLGGLAAGGLSACGFELRRAPELRFRTVLLKGFADDSALARELRAHINASRTTLVVPTLDQAQVVFESLVSTRERTVAATTAAGQVRELQLRSRLRFKLQTASGKVLIPDTELLLSRSLSYNESAALAKEQEEMLLFRGMETDIVSQIMRRLAAVSSL